MVSFLEFPAVLVDVLIQWLAEIVKPAVEGSLSLYESARKAGTVKRIVITSTMYTIMEPKEGPYVYTENDWNDSVVKLFYEIGEKSPGNLVVRPLHLSVEQHELTITNISSTPPVRSS